jgi:N-acetylneuraminic acid mutarotase
MMIKPSSLLLPLALGLLVQACSSDDSAPTSAQPSPAPGATPTTPSPAAPPDGDEPTPAEGAPSAGSEGNPTDAPLAGNGSDEPVGEAPGGDVPAAVPPGEPGQEPLAPLLSVRQEHAVAVLGGEVFVVGGFTPGATNSVEAYDPASNTWRAIAPFPSVLHHANVAVVSERLFVAGFYVGSSFTDASGSVFEYDAAGDAWTERAPLPAGTERASACVAALDGLIYLFGGARDGSVAEASVYDPDSDSWRELPPLREPREHCAAGAIGGRIVIAGGRADGIGGFQPNTWIFDPATEAYAPGAPLLTARGGVAGAVLGERLFIFGGEGNASDPSGVFPQVEAYDPATDTWEAFPDMLFPRHGLGAAADAGRIYLPGGASQQGFGAEDTHTAFVP